MSLGTQQPAAVPPPGHRSDQRGAPATVTDGRIDPQPRSNDSLAIPPRAPGSIPKTVEDIDAPTSPGNESSRMGESADVADLGDHRSAVGVTTTYAQVYAPWEVGSPLYRPLRRRFTRHSWAEARRSRRRPGEPPRASHAHSPRPASGDPAGNQRDEPQRVGSSGYLGSAPGNAHCEELVNARPRDANGLGAEHCLAQCLAAAPVEWHLRAVGVHGVMIGPW